MPKVLTEMTRYNPVQPKPEKKALTEWTGPKASGDPISYSAANIGLGIAGMFEGVYDLAIGALSQFVGDKAYTEYLHGKSEVGEWKQSLDKIYNPGKVMTFVGDVGMGVGQSSAFLLDGLAPGVGTSLFFGGVAGSGVSSAYQTTGRLGAKEYIYGAASGTVEGLLEKYVGAGGQLLGNLTGKAAPSLTKAIVSKVASKTASQAVWKGVAKSMISAGAGEFVEEFLGDYIDAFLLRATGVDKEATATLKGAAYSGLVGFASGAIMGGTTKGINQALALKEGRKVTDAGNVNVLMKQAKMVADGFKTADAKNLPEALSMLKKKINQYESTANKSSPGATIALGEIKTYLAMTEVSKGVMDVISKIDNAADVSAYAAYMSEFKGKRYTAADFRANRDNIKSDYAAQAWSTLFLRDSQSEVVSKRFNDIIAADIEGRKAGQPVVESIADSKWSGKDAIYTLDSGEYLTVTKLENGKYSIVEGTSADAVRGFTGKTEAETRDIIERLKQATIDAREWERTQARTDALQRARENGAISTRITAEQATGGTGEGRAALYGAPSIETYTAAEQDAARKVVKNFDTLPPDTRSAIVKWVNSATGVDGSIVSAVSFIMSARPGLQVIYSKLGKGHKGLYANLADIDRRLIVTSGDAAAVRETLAHELTHETKGAKEWAALRDMALKTIKADERAKIEKLYREVLGADAAAIEEEVVAKVVGKALSNKAFLDRYARRNPLVKIAQRFKQMAQQLKAKGADKVTLKQSYELMRLMDAAIKQESAKAEAEVKYNVEIKKAAARETASLQRQVDKYREQVAKLKREFKVEGENIVSDTDVRKAAAEMRKQYTSRVKGLADRLGALYSDMANKRIANIEIGEKAAIIAEDIMSASVTPSPTYEAYRGIRSIVQSGKIFVSEAIKGDFNGKYSEWARRNIPFLTSKDGVPVAVLYAELNGLYGDDFFPADIEVPSDQLKRISDVLKENKEKFRITDFEDYTAERHMLTERIIRDYEEIATRKTFAEQAKERERAAVQRQRDITAKTREQAKERIESVLAMSRLGYASDRMNRIIRGHKTSGVLADVRYKRLVETAKQIKPRTVVNVPNARLFAKTFLDFVYELAPEVLSSSDGFASDNQIANYIDAQMAKNMLEVAGGKGALSAQEINHLSSALSAIVALDQKVDKLYIAGKWVDTEPYHKKVMDGMSEQYGDKATRAIKSDLGKALKYFEMNGIDPQDAVRLIEGVLSDGVMSEAVYEIKIGGEKAEFDYVNKYIAEQIKFINENKDFWKSYNTDKVTLNLKRGDFEGEYKLTKGNAMALYATSKREQARDALALGNLKFVSDDGTAQIVEAVDSKAFENMTEDEFIIYADKALSDVLGSINKMYESLSAKDKEFIAIVERFFNEVSGKEKAKADDILLWKTNVIEGYYFPIVRSELKRDANLIEPVYNAATVRTYPWNKNTVKGAKGQLTIGDFNQIARRHAWQLSRYVNLSVPLQNFQRIYNFKGDAVGNVNSVREYINTYISRDFEVYIKSYFQDVQGLRFNDDYFNILLRKAKSKFGLAAVGANAGSYLKQFSSPINMFSEVSREAWLKGFKPINSDMLDKYSLVAANRNSPTAQYYAQGMSGALGKIGEKMMWLMQVGDRQACLQMWAMAQHQVEIEHGFAVGTEENLKLAGEMTDRFIIDIQDTSSAATKSGFARHPQEAISALTMFRSAPIKMFSRFYTAAAETAEILKRKRQGKKVSEAAVKKANKRLAMVGSAIAMSVLFEAVVTTVLAKMRGRYDKEEEEKLLSKILGDATLNMVGLVPIVGNIAESWLSGFETSFFYFDTVNAGLKSLTAAYNVGSKAIAGKIVTEAEVMRVVRDFTHWLGTVSGIPVRNLDNFSTMLIRSISPASAYKKGALISDAGATSALKAAISKGDERLAVAVIDSLYSKRTGKYDTTVSNEIARLHGEGHTALPGNLPRTVDDGEESRAVTAKEYRAMKNIYEGAKTAAKAVISDPEYAKLSDEAKARAVRSVYNAYLDKAKYDVLGVIPNKLTVLMGLVDPVALILANAHISTIHGKDRAARVTEYVKKHDKNLQAAILYSFGYNNEGLRKSVLNITKNLTKGKRERVNELLGLK